MHEYGFCHFLYSQRTTTSVVMGTARLYRMAQCFVTFIAMALLEKSSTGVGSAMAQMTHRTSAMDPSGLFFSPCTFPTPPFLSASSYSHHANQSSEMFTSICRIRQQLPFLCDLHDVMRHQKRTGKIRTNYEKHRLVLEADGRPLLAIVVVRYLAQPTSSSFITRNSPDFGCLYHLPCQVVNGEALEKFTRNFKTFTKLYTAALFHRWFPMQDRCLRPRVLALIILDGLYANPDKKLTTVLLYSDNRKLTMPYISNIQLEITNSLLQGVILSEALAELVDQVGYALRDYYHTKGVPRRHPIPPWAWYTTAGVTTAMLSAFILEWLVVTRKLSRRRLPLAMGKAIDGFRSKTHIFA